MSAQYVFLFANMQRVCGSFVSPLTYNVCEKCERDVLK